ncbi:hypothetical protein JK628_10560 [Shewanella sp. KX20019]|uniref:hypothetical protein n=1 Tax=Shewanella sp. KX20019 TaxID=2803864 RepID=UPI001928A8FF|nr:hypothetical protein [Shewanella sp. KX20019]QQX82203.1 hypothetical protein JK628_10560 [Shewanella sp. KX20019]
MKSKTDQTNVLINDYTIAGSPEAKEKDGRGGSRKGAGRKIGSKSKTPYTQTRATVYFDNEISSLEVFDNERDLNIIFTRKPTDIQARRGVKDQYGKAKWWCRIDGELTFKENISAIARDTYKKVSDANLNSQDKTYKSIVNAHNNFVKDEFLGVVVDKVKLKEIDSQILIEFNESTRHSALFKCARNGSLMKEKSFVGIMTIALLNNTWYCITTSSHKEVGMRTEKHIIGMGDMDKRAGGYLSDLGLHNLAFKD